MLSIEILGNTYSTIAFRIINPPEFTRLDLYIKEDESESTILIDQYTELKNVSDHPVLTKGQDGIYYIDVNRVDYTTVFYKKFEIWAYNISTFVDSIKTISVAPKQEGHLLGVVNKLKHDFKLSLIASGSNCVSFRSDITEEKCSCWDDILKQSNDSTCVLCDGEGNVTPVINLLPFEAKRVKTSRNRFISDKGKDSATQVVYLSYSTLDFNIGTIFFDRSNNVFYEVKDANISHIGGIRTSTSLVSMKILSNDSRLKRFAETLSVISL